VSNQQTEFADFFQASWEPCLRAVVAVVGSAQPAEDQVAEAFAKAWASWRKVRRHGDIHHRPGAAGRPATP